MTTSIAASIDTTNGITSTVPKKLRTEGGGATQLEAITKQTTQIVIVMQLAGELIIYSLFTTLLRAKMSAFSEKSFSAKGYSCNRPSYPESFYNLLDRYHQGPRNRLIDVGCGPGTATFQMADRLDSFHQIIGTDISTTMVERARSHKAEHMGQYERVHFEVSPADDFTFLGDVDQRSCDMVTAAQCAHWLDFGNFQKGVAEVLPKGGTLAVWGYADPIFPKHPKLDGILDEFTYGPNNLGPYWEPGRQHLRTLLKDLPLDRTLFTDLEEGFFDEIHIISNLHNPLLIKKTLSLEKFQKYVKTWSAHHSWRKSHPQAQKDITEEFCNRVLQVYPELTKYSKLQVVWKSFYKLGRRL